ncbi:hypothetical protein ABZS54_20830, partial [Embleya sp. NPDC005575]
MTRSAPEAPASAADRQHRPGGRRLLWAAASGVLAIGGTGLLYAGYDASGPPPRPPAAAAVPVGVVGQLRDALACHVFGEAEGDYAFGDLRE